MTLLWLLGVISGVATSAAYRSEIAIENPGGASQSASVDAVCEATGPGRCWYVAADAATTGVGTIGSPFRRPQDAIRRAGPGDFIYLRGGTDFTHAHIADNDRIMAIGRSVSSGAAEAPITIKSYPGEQAVIRGRLENRGDLLIQITRSHWRVEGLRIHAGRIVVGHGTLPGSGPRIRDVWIRGNTITGVVARWSNYGVITVTGQHTQGGPVDHELDPADIFIHDNTIRDVWAQPDEHGNVSPVPWHEDRDPEHNACFALLKSGGLVELVGNDFSECTNIFYSKWTGPGPTIIRDNYFHTARQIANRWRSSNVVFERNVFARFQRDRASFVITQGDVTGVVFRNNTFDFAPWELNPEGPRWVVAWNGHGGHVFRDNVVVTREYHRIEADFAGNDIDGNCVVWDGSLIATRGPAAGRTYTWDEYVGSFGHDRAGVHVRATSVTTVFADPANGDYTLVGDAALHCAGRGARG